MKLLETVDKHAYLCKIRAVELVIVKALSSAEELGEYLLRDDDRKEGQEDEDSHVVGLWNSPLVSNVLNRCFAEL